MIEKSILLICLITLRLGQIFVNKGLAGKSKHSFVRGILHVFFNNYLRTVVDSSSFNMLLVINNVLEDRNNMNSDNTEEVVKNV